MVHMQAYRAPEPPSRIFPECVSFQMFDNSLSVLNFLINISEKPKATPTVCSNVYPTSWTLTFYSDSINLDLASLSLFIRITYDCMHDDSYTEAGCLGHLCNWGYYKQRLLSKYLPNRCSKSYLEHRSKDSTNLLLKSRGKIHPQLQFLSFGWGVKLTDL